MNDEYRQHAFAHDAISDAAENCARDSAASMRSDGDEISIIRLRKPDDCLGNILSDNYRRTHPKLVACKAHLHAGEILFCLLDITCSCGTNRGMQLTLGNVINSGHDAEQRQ